MAEAPSGTVTLLFTDIEGSTRLLRQAGEGYTDLLLTHRRLLREAFQGHGGYEVDTEGDAFFVAFASAKEAVAAAAEAQQALATHEWPDDQRIWVRMGLHTGEPRVLDGNYVGLDVHRAARVMAAGHGGQVLLSQSTRDLLGDDASLRDLGEHRLKDLSLPQRLYQLQVEGLPLEFPALKTLENRPTNLPVQPTALIGREQELEQVRDLLLPDEVRLLTLTGPGGTGKTRLALQAAANLVEEYPGGVYFVSLAQISSAGLFVSTVAQTLGLREQPGEALLDTVGSYLYGKRMLLLLDNLEQISEAATEIAALLRAAVTLNVLATSRVPLRLSGERLYPVPPLALPDLSDPPDIDTLSQYEAVGLFIARAEAGRPDFTVTTHNAPAIAEICVRLDGLPLAVELAAARVRVLSPQAMLTRLDKRLKLLTGGSHDLDERQQTLRATIDWSYDLLSEPEQTLFARLGVFVGGCRLDAAEAVGDHDGDLGIDILDGLGSLVEQSLLRQRDDPDGEPRFWMLETIREYASERAAADTDALQERQLRHLISLFPPPWERADIWDISTIGWLVEAEQENARAVLTWALNRGDVDGARSLIARLHHAWFFKGLLQEGLAWSERALEEQPPRPITLEALEVLIAAGEFARFLGNWPRAEDLKRQALGYADESAGSAPNPGLLSDLGDVLAWRGKNREALEAHDRAITIRRGIGLPGGIAHAVGGRAESLLRMNRLDEAERDFQESLELWPGTDDRSANTTVPWHGLGEIARRRGNLEAARASFAQALRLAAAIDPPPLVAIADILASVATASADLRGAVLLLGASEALRRTQGSLVSYPDARDALVRRAQQQLAASEYEALLHAGSVMTATQAVAQALGVTVSA
jgi:predicted ATPase/class 3 adenylate cyclase